MLNCCSVRFYPVRYPLHIGYQGKASRVGMVVLWAGPWLGSIFNEFGRILQQFNKGAKEQHL